MSVTAQSLEEAATIASEFISNLDNLPSEVQHLLQEIRHKDARAQEIQQDLTKESSKYIRHALRHPSHPPPSPPATAGVNGTNGISTNGTSNSGDQEDANGETQTGNANNKCALTRIAAGHAELEKLASERVELATRIVTLLTRTRTKLDGDLVRIGILQGEVVPSGSGVGGIVGGSGIGAGMGNIGTGGGTNGVGYGGAAGEPYVLHSRNPAIAISESLRHALSGGDGVGGGGFSQKKRRLGAQSSIKLPSTTTTTTTTTTATTASNSGNSYARSRLSRQILPVRSIEEDEGDADAEGEEDAEGEDVDEGEGDEGDDQSIYCFCQKLSYGEMIACDNQDCPYQWFHLPCVGLKQPLPDRWYCSECLEKAGGGAAAETGRKGRKK